MGYNLNFLCIIVFKWPSKLKIHVCPNQVEYLVARFSSLTVWNHNIIHLLFIRDRIDWILIWERMLLQRSICVISSVSSLLVRSFGAQPPNGERLRFQFCALLFIVENFNVLVVFFHPFFHEMVLYPTIEVQFCRTIV